MIKRTLYFGNPAYLKIKNEQLLIEFPDPEQKPASVPVEDIGVVVLDNPQITISQVCLAKLLENNASIIACDERHHPKGLFLNLEGHTLQSARNKAQLEASLPLKKQLWQQTISAKIENQAAVLKRQGVAEENMRYWAKNVKSGDTDNIEGRAAAYYWKSVFLNNPEFIRDRSGLYPNNLLNYGYAILRATVARGLVASGLFPSFGIHHRNQYNAFCLADDIMEPYRPIVDLAVLDLMAKYPETTTLSKEIKQVLLSIPSHDIIIDQEKSPLMVGLQRTTNSLVLCFEGKERKIKYPVLY